MVKYIPSGYARQYWIKNWVSNHDKKNLADVIITQNILQLIISVFCIDWHAYCLAPKQIALFYHYRCGYSGDL